MTRVQRLAPPSFGSVREFVATLGDAEFWRSHVGEILRRHGLGDADASVVAGHNATHPTFVCGDVVVKLFGQYGHWPRAYAAEHAAHAAIAADVELRAPRLLAAGALFHDDDAPWPYLVTSRMPGTPWSRAELSADQRHAVVAELGRLVRGVHALPRGSVATEESWQPPAVAAANARSSLPPHLVAQIDGFLAGIAPFDRVVVHGDIVANHVFVEDGRLAGVIDWGDTTWTDRHAELIQIHRDLFDCDKDVLRLFLDASGWPVRGDFARQAMGHALHRQAIGVAQHPSAHSIDVFQPVAAKFPLRDVATLDELAELLFGV